MIAMTAEILQDALFAAIAAIGFAAISRPPRRAYLWCALLAAAGHSLRFILLRPEIGGSLHIVPATFAAAFAVGVMAVLLSQVARMPAETFLFPSLLPMIPGIYAYKAFGAMAMCVFSGERAASFGHFFYLMASNTFTCLCVLLAMVVGATVPIFMLRRMAFQATRK